MTRQIKRHLAADSNGFRQRHVREQGDGVAVSRRVDRALEGRIIDSANARDSASDRTDLVRVLFLVFIGVGEDAVAFRAGVGHVDGEVAAGDVADSGRNVLAVRAGDRVGTASDVKRICRDRWDIIDIGHINHDVAGQCNIAFLAVAGDIDTALARQTATGDGNGTLAICIDSICCRSIYIQTIAAAISFMPQRRQCYGTVFLGIVHGTGAIVTVSSAHLNSSNGTSCINRAVGKCYIRIAHLINIGFNTIV